MCVLCVCVLFVAFFSCAFAFVIAALYLVNKFEYNSTAMLHTACGDEQLDPRNSIETCHCADQRKQTFLLPFLDSPSRSYMCCNVSILTTVMQALERDRPIFSSEAKFTASK